jgi:hypothetical protein
VMRDWAQERVRAMLVRTPGDACSVQG